MKVALCPNVNTFWGNESLPPAPVQPIDELAFCAAKSGFRKFEKEFRVVFHVNNDARSIGLRYTASPHRTTPTNASYHYTCVVAGIEEDGQSATYNSRCKMMGNYAHLIVEHLRIRAVNDQDVNGMDYESVVTCIEKVATRGITSKTTFTLTFADVSSKLKMAKSRFKKAGNTVLATMVTHHSFPKSPGSPSKTWGSFSKELMSPRRPTMLSSVSNDEHMDHSVLVGDLEAKNRHLEAQLCTLQATMVELERERKQAENAITVLSIQEPPADQVTMPQEAVAQPVNQDPTSTSEEETTTELMRCVERLIVAQQDLSALQERYDRVQNEKNNLEAQMKEQATAFDELTIQDEGLRNTNETLTLQLRELRVEHDDAQRHAEELHHRLVETQTQLNRVNMELQNLLEHYKREQQELDTVLEDAGIDIGSLPRRPSVSTSTEKPLPVDIIRKLMADRTAHQSRIEELYVEMSCHETTASVLRTRIIELEDKWHHAEEKSELLEQTLATVSPSLSTSSVNSPSSATDNRIVTLQQQLQILRTTSATAASTAATTIASLQTQLAESTQRIHQEKDTVMRLQNALQRLEDKARGQLEQHTQDQRVLTQFKELLVTGIAVTKYGNHGAPHVRILYSDAQCRWISWRDPSIGSTSPRSQTKCEILNLVEVLYGTETDVFHSQRTAPTSPTRCFSLVFVHPCRTLDVEVESKERAETLVHSFRLLLDEAMIKRRQREP